MANYTSYDIQIVSADGEVTLHGSKHTDSVENYIGYEPPLEGWGEVDIRTTSFLFSGADGGMITDQYRSMRQIPITAWIMGKTQAEIDAGRMAMNQALPIKENVSVYLIDPQGNRYGVIARVLKVSASIPYAKDSYLVQDYDIELVAGDPLIYDFSTDQIEIQVPRVMDVGGLLWSPTGLLWEDDGLHWQMGANPVIINNTGNTMAYPIIEIDGIVHNPELFNISADRIVSLNISTGPNDNIVIDMNAETITLNGGSIINNAIRKDWWGLTPGPNTIKFTTASSDDVNFATIKYRNAFNKVV